MPTSNAENQSRGVLVLTDSTASLPELAITELGIRVVNLHVIHNEHSYEENKDVSAQECSAWVSNHEAITTSQPSRESFAQAYRQAYADGYEAIVVATLSAALSGTYSNAVGAASDVGGPIMVIDSNTTGMALGLAVMAGARASLADAPPALIASTITKTAERSVAYFMVDSLDHLRRGGRLSAAAAALGTVLGMKPILTIDAGGMISVHTKVRSRNGALQFLLEAGQKFENASEFGVHYFGDDSSAQSLAHKLQEATGKPAYVTSASAVLGAHVGPGMVAVACV